MARKLEYKLSKGLKEQILKAMDDSSLLFRGEIILKGTNLLRGEYGECSILIQGFAYRSDIFSNKVEFVIYDGCLPTGGSDSITVAVNRNLELDQTIRLIVLSIANHEYYEI